MTYRQLLQCITQPEYDKKLELFNDTQQNINLDRTDHTQADLKYHITAKQTLELARRAGELFERANDAEKNELLKLVLSNATFDGRKLVFSIRKPFDTISNVKGFPVLLRRQDSNLRQIDYTGPNVSVRGGLYHHPSRLE